MIASRRNFLGMTAAAFVAPNLIGCTALGGFTPTQVQKPAFVLLHGAWHGAWAYAKVIPELAARGHAAVAIDLPGHGLDAKFPQSYQQRPLDRATFSQERSPLAAVTLDECVEHVVGVVDNLRAGGFTSVVLVGHSLSGVLVTRVGEMVPEKLSSLVYASALMLPEGQTAGDVFALPQAAGSEVPELIMANPGAVGASRIDPASPDPIYRARAKSAFYGDLSDSQFEAVAHLLTPDEPVALAGVRTEKTVARWGSLKRSYLMCTEDRTVPPALQQLFIEQADAYTPNNKTNVRKLKSSHSPFLSMPREFAIALSDMASAS